MPRQLTPATSVENLKKEAKRWLRHLRAGDARARVRLQRAYPDAPANPVLRDVQHALALEHGYQNWIALKEAVSTAHTVEDYERLAESMVLASSGDESSLRRLNDFYRRSFTLDDLGAEIWRRVYAFRQRSSRTDKNSLQSDEAKIVIAQDAGFSSWEALTRSIATGAPPVPPYELDPEENVIRPRRRLGDSEWDELISVMRERRIAALDANGLMTDAVLSRITQLDHVTALNLSGSRELTDDGLLQLSRMPQLQRLGLNEYPGGRLTDRGLEVLRHLPNLQRFELTWQGGVSDAGIANLKFCDQLEHVDLMGSPTGDGAIEALRGKLKLRYFNSGKLVTDAGLRQLHRLPSLTHLLIDGPFTSDGLASVAKLEPLAELDLFWHATSIPSDAFAHLTRMPNLESLGCDGELSDDAAMRHIAAIPHLKKLRAQETVATDDGFEALSRSQSLESFWGRDCPNLGSRGFVAFSKMPALRALGASVRNVDEAALSSLPRFPALCELTSIGFHDDGFRHIGRCEKLERLRCMDCRDTTDRATEHIAGLHLKDYYAGLTRITDRSLEILGRMSTLESVEFYQCKGITDAGLVHLATLPRLRRIELGELPGVTLEGTSVFPPSVRVRYGT